MQVTSNDSRVRLYDLRDHSLKCKYRGMNNTSSQIKATFSPDGKSIICGSEDHRFYTWPVAPPCIVFDPDWPARVVCCTRGLHMRPADKVPAAHEHTWPATHMAAAHVACFTCDLLISALLHTWPAASVACCVRGLLHVAAAHAACCTCDLLIIPCCTHGLLHMVHTF
jgi:hypothetical protein